MRLFFLAVLTLVGCGSPSSTRQDMSGAICEAYLDCLAAVQPQMLAVAQELYGETGACWASESNATRCEQACSVAYEDVIELDEDGVCTSPEEGGGPVDVVPEEGRWDLVASSGSCSEHPIAATIRHRDAGFELELLGTSVRLGCEVEGPDFECDTLGVVGSLDGPATGTAIMPLWAQQCDTDTFTMTWRAG